jgi:membrane-associated phospholipid phosphatase
MNVKLPLIDSRKKWLWAAIGYALFCAFYLSTGNLHFRSPALLTPSRIDEAIPFADWTIWIYHSQFWFLLLTIHLVKRAENLTRTFYAMALASLSSFCVFLIYPTTIPRNVQAASGLTDKAFQFLYAVDSPTNCFPSLHVALATLAAIAMLGERKSLGSIAVVWALLISLSTLTTKQHYVIDLIGGLLIARLCRFLAVKFS